LTHRVTEPSDDMTFPSRGAGGWAANAPIVSPRRVPHLFSRRLALFRRDGGWNPGGPAHTGYGANAMNPDEPNASLAQQATLWSVVLRAHHGPTDEQMAARRQLVEHYGGALQRHLRQVLRDPEAVNELYQEVALRIMNGAFHRADPARG